MKPKLTINNSYSRLEGMTLVQQKAIANVLSYEVDAQAAWFAGGHRSRTRHLIDKKGSFPTGLLHHVMEHFGEGLEVVDLRVRPESKKTLFYLSLSFTPYEEQVSSVEECVKAGRGTVSAVTGFGKSITMALLVNKLQLRTLIIVPNLSLKKQLSDSFKEYFGATPRITIENIDSPSLKSAKDYDVLIIDEAHHSAAKTYRNLNKTAWNSIFHRFFFTATPFRSKDEEQLLYESIAGQVIYTVSHKTAVEKGYIAPVEAYVIELPKSTVEGHTWPQVYSELVVNNTYRNRVIQELLSKLHANKCATLCLVKEIKHGDNIVDLTGAGFANGVSDDCQFLIQAFNEGKIKTLIGTTGVLGEGVDSKPAEFIIIAGLGKSRNQFLQQAGRGFRRYPGKESCKIIIFKDPSHKFTLAHYKAQCKILKEDLGVIPVKLDICLF